MPPRQTKSKKQNKKQKNPKKPTSYKGLVKLIKKVTLKQSESKSCTYSWGKTELNHNTYHFIGEMNTSFAFPQQGVGDNQRIGDRIKSSGYKLRLLCGQKYDRPNVTWKFWVLKQPINYSTGNSFRNVTGNVLLDPPNLDQVIKVLKVFTWKPDQSTMLVSNGSTASQLTKEYTFTKSIWIPHKHDYKFQTDAQRVHDETPIVIVATCYDAFGTLVTDNIAYIQIFQELFYRDI